MVPHLLASVRTAPHKGRVLAFVGGGACATGAALAAASAVSASPTSLFAACEEVRAQAGDLFLWGKRFTGNEVIGYCDKVPVLLGLPGAKKVVHAAFGVNVGAACDQSGDVWFWGDFSQNKPPHTADMSHAEISLRGKHIVKVACGATHSYALSSTGRVWTWPNANPRAALEIPVPGGMLVRGSAVDLAACAGGKHLLCVTSDGRALAMGAGAKGQLGCGDCEDKLALTAVKLPAGEKAARVAAGAEHSLVLTQRGKVLAFGADDVMQLGLGRATIAQWREDKEPLTSSVFRTEPMAIVLPQALDRDAKCVRIACGHDFSAAIFATPDKPNCLVTWGNGWRKQLGHKNDMHMSAPRIVSSLQGHKEWSEKAQRVQEMGVAEVACGQEHALALLDNGSLLSWGGNREGEVGNDSRRDVRTPQLVMPLQRYRIKAAFAGGRNSAVLIQGLTEHLQ